MQKFICSVILKFSQVFLYYDTIFPTNADRVGKIGIKKTGVTAPLSKITVHCVCSSVEVMFACVCVYMLTCYYECIAFT